MHEYNSQLEDLNLKEYGRNIQKIAKHIATIADEDQKSRMAHTLVGLMKQINPNSKDNQDYDQMVWDHMYLISELKLTINDSPYPKPTSTIQDLPKRVEYGTGEIRYLHYGRNVERLIEKAIAIEDAEEKESAVIQIAKIMKRFYNTWNKDNVEPEIIINHIEILSKKKLTLDVAKVKEENLLQLPRDTKGGPTNQPFTSSSPRPLNRRRNNNGHSNNSDNRRRRKN